MTAVFAFVHYDYAPVFRSALCTHGHSVDIDSWIIASTRDLMRSILSCKPEYCIREPAYFETGAGPVVENVMNFNEDMNRRDNIDFGKIFKKFI